MKTRRKLSVLLLVASLGLGACGGGGGDAPLATASEATLSVAADGSTTVDIAALSRRISTYPVQSLSAEERASLLYMREEEKLAKDVYTTLNTLWGSSVTIFRNISASEATHTEAVKTLLVRYSVPDPAATNPVGVFVNQHLQEEYDHLVASGSVSLVEALKAGALIEETDITDLKTALVYIDNQDIRQVYSNLLAGSNNHLRAFVSALKLQGVTYTPVVLSTADYQAIVGTTFQTN